MKTLEKIVFGKKDRRKLKSIIKPQTFPFQRENYVN